VSNKSSELKSDDQHTIYLDSSESQVIMMGKNTEVLFDIDSQKDMLQMATKTEP